MPFKTTLPWPLPPLRRAVRGYLGRRTVLIDELPPDRRPSAFAIHQPVDGLEPLEGELTVLSYNVQRGQRLQKAASTVECAVEEYLSLIHISEPTRL